MTKFFCSAPFTQISIDPRGVLLPCCRFPKPLSDLKDERIDKGWNGKGYQELRQRFLDGEKPEECFDCWHAEDAGMESLREITNKVNNGKTFTSSFVETPPEHWEFKTTNVCNLKCRICGPFNSSQLAKENETVSKELRNHYLAHKLIGTHHEPIVYEWLKKADYILFAGGEPFVNQEIKKIMDYIDQNDLNDIRTLIVTNGTHWNKKFVNQLKKLESLDIRISLDDIYERNDYQRDGSNFDIIEQNFINFSTHFPGQIMFNCTVNWFNIFHIDEFLEYADDFNTPVSIQFVEQPKYMNIIHLPTQVKERINHKFGMSNDERIKLILNRMNIESTLDWDVPLRFFRHIDWYDPLRKTDFNKAFPEWSEILNELR